MTNKGSKPARRPVKKGGKFFPALCNIIGTLILLAVIITSFPIALPRFFGYNIYNVETGSMEPALPVGSVIYVETVEPDLVQPGDIIAYNVDGTIVTHRVVENRFVKGEYVTKEDANAQEDFTNVQYSDLIGRVKYHIPMIGRFMMLYASTVGKIYLLGLAACGVMFNMLAGRIRSRQDEKFRMQLQRWEKQRAMREKAETEAAIKK